MLKTLVVKINNMSSKFSSPFFKKSPLYGAYTSGAGGMVTVSYNDIHQKFQDGIAKNVAKHYGVGTNPCDDPLTTSYNKDGVYKKCPTVTTTKEEKEIDRGGLPKGYGGAQTQAGYDYFNMKEGSANSSGSSSGIDPNTGMGFRNS